MPQALTKTDVVSSESENLILVNSSDEDIGVMSKADCHDGDGRLHRAFSIFLMNSKDELLLQQRASNKRLWPMYWSNSCCSHPRAGEESHEASVRRLQQEIGISTALEFIYKFEYRAPFGTVGTEHELCWVFIGRSDDPPVINTTEINDWQWVGATALSAELETRPEQYTPWFKQEWHHLMTCYSDKLLAAR